MRATMFSNKPVPTGYAGEGRLSILGFPPRLAYMTSGRGWSLPKAKRFSSAVAASWSIGEWGGRVRGGEGSFLHSLGMDFDILSKQDIFSPACPFLSSLFPPLS